MPTLKIALLPLVALICAGSVGQSAKAVLVADADLEVTFGDAQLSFVPGTGLATTMFNVSLQNNSSSDAFLAAYSLFIDISPSGLALPIGVSFDTSATSYSGAGPISSTSGTSNLAPAAGDLGIGQLQFFNGTIPANTDVDILTVHLVIDRSLAIPGDYDLTLAPAGENSLLAISSSGGPPIDLDFAVRSGALSIVAVPEASAWLQLFAVSVISVGFVLRRKSRAIALFP